MTLEIDHLFILCDEDAPEGEALLRLGLREGPPNTHPGQGTANRRFVFQGSYLELAWVADAEEARSDLARPTGLWERWSRRRQDASPFGLVLRPGGDGGAGALPFPTWEYRPPYLPPPLAIDVARDVPLEEPAIFHLAFARPRPLAPEITARALPLGHLTAVTFTLPAPSPRSPAGQAMQAAGLVTFTAGDAPLAELTFDGGAGGASADLRPTLPLILRW
jgi:hypothetical protein